MAFVLPGDMIEAAQIDGAGTLRCFIHVVLPVRWEAGSSARAQAPLACGCWNLVEQPLTYLTTHTELYPLSVVFNQLTQQSTGVEFAGAALYTLPALLIYLYFQKRHSGRRPAHGTQVKEDKGWKNGHQRDWSRLAAVVALCMFFSGTIKTISTAKVKLVTAKQGKLEEEIKLSGNLTFPQTEDVKLALTSDQSVTIKRVRVAKGRRVAAGDVLFEAEVSGYDKEMESLRGESDAAQKELMELERKNGDVRLKRTEEIWVEAYDALAKSKEDCMTAQTQLEVAAKLAGVTLSGGRLPSGETDETLTDAQKAVDAAQAAQDETQKKFNSAIRLGHQQNVINYITQSRQLNEKLATTQEKITALDVLAQRARQVTAPHDGYIVEINVRAGDSYDGKTAALVISSESGDAVLRADTSKIEKKIDKGTQVTVKRDSDKTLTKKVTDSGVNEEGKRYIDVKLTDKDITNLGGGAALFSAAVEMTASYRASSSTTLLPASAVRGSGDSRYPYIVSEESNALGQRVLKVKKQDVKVLSEVGSMVSIQDDLSRQRVALWRIAPSATVPRSWSMENKKAPGHALGAASLC